MASQEIKQGFESLGHLEYSQLPSDDELNNFLRDVFRHAELLLNSFPSIYSEDVTKPESLKEPNSAKSADDTFLDPSTIPKDYEPQEASPELSKAWGKPLKVSAKENPLSVSIWKHAAHDRQSAWFARRSVHQGLGFERWKRCMQREFLTSLKVKGGPGAGAVRGIAADRMLESKTVPGVGELSVYQLSSAFPGPTTSREFVTLAITTEQALTPASAPKASEDKKPGRSLLCISRPTTHPDAPDRSGYVKGTYESAELIRELPLYPDNPEMNPVEWLMITRSDPGGGIPKFLVERGTPGSVVGDVPKFINWAIKQGDVPPYDNEEMDKERQQQEKAAATSDAQDGTSHATSGEAGALAAGVAVGSSSADAKQSQEGQAGHHRQPSNTPSSYGGGPAGYLTSLRNAVGETFTNYLGHFSDGGLERVSSDSSSDISDASYRTFGTADNHADHRTETHAQADSSVQGASDCYAKDQSNGTRHKHADSNLSGATSELLAADTPAPSQRVDSVLAELETRKPNNMAEKDLIKATDRRRQLDARIAAVRISAQEQRRTIEELERDPAASGTEERKDATKDQQAKAEKAAKEFEKQEAKYLKEIAKIEEKRDKLAQKVEEKRSKAVEKDELKRAKGQRDEWKERVRAIERENEILRRQVDGLQKDNTILVAHIGDQTLVRQILREGNVAGPRSRAGSMKETAQSIHSSRSGEKA